MIEVYRASGEVEANVIKGLLESFGIPCVIRSNAAPSVYAFAIDLWGGYKVMVDDSRAEEAKKLITREEDA